MDQKKEVFIEFSIRVPKTLNEKLQVDADENKRSRNKQVVAILEDHYDSRSIQKDSRENGN